MRDKFSHTSRSSSCLLLDSDQPLALTSSPQLSDAILLSLQNIDHRLHLSRGTLNPEKCCNTHRSVQIHQNMWSTAREIADGDLVIVWMVSFLSSRKYVGLSTESAQTASRECVVLSEPFFLTALRLTRLVTSFNHLSLLPARSSIQGSACIVMPIS